MSCWPEGVTACKSAVGSPESELSPVRWCTSALVANFCSEGLIFDNSQTQQHSPSLETQALGIDKNLGQFFAGNIKSLATCTTAGHKGETDSPSPTVIPFQKDDNITAFFCENDWGVSRQLCLNHTCTSCLIIPDLVFSRSRPLPLSKLSPK